MRVKLALVVRTDLGMSKGKIAAQTAHAAVAAVLGNYGSAVFARWLHEGQPKIVLRVTGEDQLRDVCDAAGSAGLPVEVVLDAGRTQVAAGTATCCAIGPGVADDIDRVVGTLPLL
jgi:peptidyl-tRNA hydrolase, PTH2 family